MAAISLKINFPNHDDYIYDLEEDIYSSGKIPQWAYFDMFPCTGNICRGSGIDHCRLSFRLASLIAHFKDIKSYEKGRMVACENDFTETIFKGDAQTLFFKAVSVVLLKTECPVFNCGQNIRPRYAISSDIDTIFYTFYSIFLFKKYAADPTETVLTESFSQYLDLVFEVLECLRNRIKYATNGSADACENGIVIFEQVVQILQMDLTERLEKLKCGGRQLPELKCAQ